MTVLLDTNLLTRPLEPLHHHHQPAVDALAALLAARERVCIVPQNLYEFYVVATRPAKDHGLGRTPRDAQAMVERFEQLYSLIEDTPVVYAQWKALIVAHGVAGKSAHDARLAAAMLAHGITRLLTFNGADFKRYPHVQVIDPPALSSSGASPP